jgi:hypothetical protein
MILTSRQRSVRSGLIMLVSILVVPLIGAMPGVLWLNFVDVTLWRYPEKFNWAGLFDFPTAFFWSLLAYPFYFVLGATQGFAAGLVLALFSWRGWALGWLSFLATATTVVVVGVALFWEKLLIGAHPNYALSEFFKWRMFIPNHLALAFGAFMFSKLVWKNQEP